MKADPGYEGTAKMVTEAALALALDKSKLDSYGHIKPLKGGVLTCASALGFHLVRRLRANVMEITVEDL